MQHNCQYHFLNYAYARRLRRTLFSKSKKRFNFHHKGEGEMEALTREFFSSPTYLSWNTSLHVPKVLTLLHRHTD